MSLRRWLAATPVRPIRRRPTLGLVSLEDRTTPAITTASFAGGVLTVTADGANDIIELVLQGGQIRVLEGATQTERAVTGAPVTPLALTQIVINAGDGDDVVVVANNIKDPVNLNGGTGSDNLTGGGGHDNIVTGTDNVGDTANGNDGNDTITGGAGDDLLQGGKGNDVITGGDGVNNIQGGVGNDILTGGDSIDDIAGNLGNDSITGGAGDDRLRGDDNRGKPGHDTVIGGIGDDTVTGGSGNDRLDGGIGNDRAEGGAGHDTLIGGPETIGLTDSDADQLFGGSGNDTATGGAGDDALYGETGRDSLVGGAGMDSLSGGLNRDIFVGHGTTAPGTGAATDAANFDTYKDEFDLTRPLFGKAEPKDVAVTELGIWDALSGLASISNGQADFNIASRIRYLGSGDYLVKLGPTDPGGDDVNNPSPFGWFPVSFNGTWTDNDPRPSAGERLLPVKSAIEMREFWTVLYHRAVAQSIAPGYDPFVYYDQAAYEALDPRLTDPGAVVEELSGQGAIAFDLTSGPPAGFSFADIQSMLKAPFWLTAEAEAAPTQTGIVANQAYAITRAFTVAGQNYITLYNASGRDTATAGQTLDQNVIKGKDDGFITLREDVFYANFATAFVN
jgi:Ca2+-binding RTX toxin-like protein